MTDGNLNKGNNYGRPVGSKNKVTAEIKDILAGSLDKLGGEAYFIWLGANRPEVYAGLIKQVIPKQVNTTHDVADGFVDKIAAARQRMINPEQIVESALIIDVPAVESKVEVRADTFESKADDVESEVNGEYSAKYDDITGDLVLNPDSKAKYERPIKNETALSRIKV